MLSQNDPVRGWVLESMDSGAAAPIPFFLARPATDGLVERVRRGDHEALGQVYDEHHEHVRAFARRLLGEHAAAEDLVQETFLALPSSLSAYRGEGPLRSFVLSMAVNHARHHVRAAMRRRAVHDRSALASTATLPRTPEDELVRREVAAKLTRALDRLSVDQRIAIVLCEVEQRTCGEVAEILGAPEATVRTRVFHGKKRLRDLLAREGLR